MSASTSSVTNIGGWNPNGIWVVVGTTASSETTRSLGTAITACADLGSNVSYGAGGNSTYLLLELPSVDLCRLYQAKWQAATWSFTGPARRGSTSEQICSARGQRV